MNFFSCFGYVKGVYQIPVMLDHIEMKWTLILHFVPVLSWHGWNNGSFYWSLMVGWVNIFNRWKIDQFIELLTENLLMHNGLNLFSNKLTTYIILDIRRKIEYKNEETCLSWSLYGGSSHYQNFTLNHRVKKFWNLYIRW